MSSERDDLIEYAKCHLCDMIPYDDPQYEELLQGMAENYADMMLGITPWPDMGKVSDINEDELPF